MWEYKRLRIMKIILNNNKICLTCGCTSPAQKGEAHTWHCYWHKILWLDGSYVAGENLLPLFF